MRDDEWGFFVDLELDYERKNKKTINANKTKTTINRINYNLNYLTTIYEEDYWHEKDENYETETETENMNKKNERNDESEDELSRLILLNDISHSSQ